MDDLIQISTSTAMDEENDLNHRNARRDDEEGFEFLQEPQSDESLYALFNLPKSATTDEIHKRYKAVAGEFWAPESHIWLRPNL